MQEAAAVDQSQQNSCALPAATAGHWCVQGWGGCSSQGAGGHSAAGFEQGGLAAPQAHGPTDSAVLPSYQDAARQPEDQQHSMAQPLQQEQLQPQQQAYEQVGTPPQQEGAGAAPPDAQDQADQHAVQAS
jgi:hypothetical protein